LEAKPISNNYNKSAELNLENRMKAYNLTKDEKGQVWKIAGERDTQLKEAKDYFNDNFEELKSKEYKNLKGKEQPKPQYNMGNSKKDYNNLASKAQANVQKNYHNIQNEIAKNADKQISAILKNSKERDKQQDPNLQQDFQQAHDHDRQRGR
jgi:hypothetical protein